MQSETFERATKLKGQIDSINSFLTINENYEISGISVVETTANANYSVILTTDICEKVIEMLQNKLTDLQQEFEQL